MTTATAGTSTTSPPIEHGAVVKYVPNAQIGTASGLKGLLDKMRDSIAASLPRHVTPERLIKTMLVAANRNAKLLQCTQASILETINRAAELGLDLSGTLGEAYPVPFTNSVKDAQGNWTKQTQCQLIIGYRGLEKLAWQSGEVQMIDAEVVHERDLFIFKKGFDPRLEWEPCRDGDRGEPIGAYALIITKLGGRMARFMTVADIEKIRQGAQSKDSPAWKNHWGEMARKTALRRVLKDAPLSTEKLVAAMESDDKDYELTDVLEAETTRPGGSSGLLKKLKGGGEEVPEPSHVGDVAGEIIDQTETPEDAANKAKVAEQAEKLKQQTSPKKTLEEAAGESTPELSPDELHQARKAAKTKHGCKQGKKGCADDGKTLENIGYLCSAHDPANQS